MAKNANFFVLELKLMSRDTQEAKYVIHCVQIQPDTAVRNTETYKVCPAMLRYKT